MKKMMLLALLLTGCGHAPQMVAPRTPVALAVRADNPAEAAVRKFYTSRHVRPLIVGSVTTTSSLSALKVTAAEPAGTFAFTGTQALDVETNNQEAGTVTHSHHSQAVQGTWSAATGVVAN